jgi:Ino eighty subunit 1
MMDPFEDSDADDAIPRTLVFGTEVTAPPFREKGFRGLTQLVSEVDDFAEEFTAYGAALRRAHRRMVRWKESGAVEVVPPTKKRRLENGVANGVSADSKGGGEDGDERDERDERVDRYERDERGEDADEGEDGEESRLHRVNGDHDEADETFEKTALVTPDDEVGEEAEPVTLVGGSDAERD